MNKNVLSYERATQYVRETLEIANMLTKDMKRIIDATKAVTFESELQFWFRIAVRTAIDSIDALVLRLRFLAKKIIKMRGDEYKLHPKPKGKDIRFFFKELAVALNSTFKVEKDDKRLQAYHDAREIRHRVTHPKRLKDLNVSLDEYEKVIDAYGWFDYCLKQIKKQSNLPKK